MAEDYLSVALDWDSELEDTGEGSFEPLEEGTYRFKVTDFERGRYEPRRADAKMKACPQAIYDIEIMDNGSNRISKCKEFLPLNTLMMWKIRKFFRCIGDDVPHGVAIKPDWKGAVGKEGMCRVGIVEKGGKKYNQVEEFLEPMDNTPVKDEDDW